LFSVVNLLQQLPPPTPPLQPIQPVAPAAPVAPAVVSQIAARQAAPSAPLQIAARQAAQEQLAETIAETVQQMPQVVTQAAADAVVVTGKTETISKAAEDVTGVAVESSRRRTTSGEICWTTCRARHWRILLEFISMFLKIKNIIFGHLIEFIG
jgi:hypothetical protein